MDAWKPPHLSHYIREEMEARGWDRVDLARRMGGSSREERLHDLCAIDLFLAVQDKRLLLDGVTAAKLAFAFKVPREFLENLDRAWRAAA